MSAYPPSPPTAPDGLSETPESTGDAGTALVTNPNRAVRFKSRVDRGRTAAGKARDAATATSPRTRIAAAAATVGLLALAGRWYHNHRVATRSRWARFRHR